MKTFRKIRLLALATAMAIPTVAMQTAFVYAEEIAAQTTDADGYTLLGSVQSVNKVNNRVELEFIANEKMHITFLEDNVFRLYLAPEGENFLEYPTPNSSDHKATITAKSDGDYISEYNVQPTVEESDTKILIKTNSLLLEIDKATSMMKLMRTDLSVVWEESAPLKYKSGSTIQTLKSSADEYFFGGGTQNGRFSHKGKKIDIVNTNNWVDKGVASPNPFYWSTSGYGVVRNTWKPGQYDFDSSNSNTVKTTHNEKRFDAYYFVDDNFNGILKDYYELTGTPAELPEYASYLGYLNCWNRDYWKEVPQGTNGAVKLGSKWYVESQTDNGGTKETLLGDGETTAAQIIRDHKDNDMPIGWFLPNDGYGCGYGQTATQAGDIENLKEFAEYAKNNGLETGLWTQSNLWPADRNNPQKGERDIYKEVQAGVHAVKTDVAWVGAGYSMALNGISVAYDAMLTQSDMKPNIVTLDGWAGTQRYGGIWTGDQSGGQWEYIRFHIPTYIGTALSGQPNVGSDMDGIFGGKNPIINIRDFQWKAFTTFMLDMDGWGSNQKTPYALGENATSINRAYLKLKAQLMPYLNTISHEATINEGLPMLRAMFLEEANAYTLGSATQYQYMWGDNFLVAPVYQNTASDAAGNDVRNDIYLPSTSDIWTDYFTGKQYRGGQVLNDFDAPLWKLPVFVKNGSIIPMYTENNNPEPITDTNKDGLDRSKRIVEFYPHGSTEFNVFEDDGLTLNGASTNTLLTSKVEGNVATLKANKTTGSYAGMVKNRETEFIVNVSEEPTSVTGKVAGSDVTFTKVNSQAEYDAATGNVYFYNPTPSIFVKEFATAGTAYASTTETTTPKLYVKSTVKTDVTANDFEVVINGFKNVQDLGSDELNESIPVPTGLAEVSKTDSEIHVNWDAVTEATTYDIEVDGVVFRNVKNPTYDHVGLAYLTDHTYRVRSVNSTGYSNWSDMLTIQTADNPYRNVPENLKVTWTYGASWGAVANAFDHDINTMFHSTSAVTPEQMMTIDLGAAYQMDYFTYQPRMDNKGNGAVTRMDLYGSLDGVNYKKLWDGMANPAWTYNKQDMSVADIKTMPLNGTKIRYIKLSVRESAGGFFSASELTPYKVNNTGPWIVGDVNNSGKVDDNDLIFYDNYVGLKPVDADWEYVALGNIDENNRIDAYDISFVARMLGAPITQAASGVEGKIQIIPSKTDIKAGDTVTLDVYGIGMKNVNAFSIELPVNTTQFEVTNAGAASLSSVFMRNFSKVRLHTDGTTDNYTVFTNVGKQDLINGTTSLSKITIKALQDFTWDSSATQALLVGQDLSTVNAIIDNSVVPPMPETKAILKSSDIQSITFDNAVKTGMDGSELWQQSDWRSILFDGDKAGTLAEFKWYFGTDNIAAEVMIPVDMNFTFNKSEPLKSIKVYNRKNSNGTVTSIKATAYDGDTAYDLGSFSSYQEIFTFNIPAEATKIDKVVLTPMSSMGTATGTTTGSEANRMLSLYEIEFLTDSKVSATGIQFNSTSATKVYVDALAEVSATVAPTNVSNPYYNITSSDDSIAKVVKIPMETKNVFVIQGVSAGTVTLTATSEDGSLVATQVVEVVAGVDTTALDAQLTKFEALYENLYTPTSWNKAQGLYNDAKLLLADSGTTQGAVDAITTDIIKAMNELKFKGSNNDQVDNTNLIPFAGMSLYDESSFTAAEEEHGNLAIDGDINTFWHSNYNSGYKLPQWITIDLGASYDINQIDYTPRQNSRNGAISHYRIEVSNEVLSPKAKDVSELTFTPVVEGYFENDGTALTNPNDAKRIKFDTTTARYVRFIAVESLGSEKDRYASIAELSFFGTQFRTIDDLTTILDEAENILLDQGDDQTKTTSSLAALQVAFDAAQAVADKVDPTSIEINEAIINLQAAINGLKAIASDVVVSGLQDTITAVKALESEYTEAEFATLKQAIEDAETLLASDRNDISSDAVLLALKDIVDAKESLPVHPQNPLLDDLKIKVTYANTLLAADTSKYRPAKVQALRDAVAAGQLLIDEASSDVDTLQAAIDAVDKAIQEYWEIVSKVELNNLVTIYGAAQEANYTVATWAPFQAAIDAAKAVVLNDDATTQEVETAKRNLIDAYNALKKVEVLDKTALMKEIATVESMLANSSKYVASSIKDLPAALTAAKQALATSTSQAQLDAATKALILVEMKARLKADTSVLQALVAQAEVTKLSGYTNESVTNFQNALANAEAILQDEEATQAQVDAIVTGLQKAIDGLTVIKKDDKANENSNNSNNVPTGDNTNLQALYLMLVLSLGIVVYTRRRKESE